MTLDDSKAAVDKLRTVLAANGYDFYSVAGVNGTRENVLACRDYCRGEISEEVLLDRLRSSRRRTPSDDTQGQCQQCATLTGSILRP